MNNKNVKIASAVLGALGVIFILIMVFDVVPGVGNIMLFMGIICFVLAGIIRNIAKIKSK